MVTLCLQNRRNLSERQAEQKKGNAKRERERKGPLQSSVITLKVMMGVCV